MAEQEPRLDDKKSPWHKGRRVSLREAMIWITVISIALAIPIALDLPLLPVIFYGTLGALTWRLSKAMPFNLAVLIAILAAVTITCACIPVLLE